MTMEIRVTHKINHQKLTGEWCRHCKGKFRKLSKKRRRSWLKMYAKSMEG